MLNRTNKTILSVAASASAMAICLPAHAQEAYGEDDTIIVTGQATTYTNSQVTEAMVLQQAPITSPLAQIDSLPGVNVQEGDTFGFDDWSTAISVRGFQTNLDTQEIGMTIDGLPNGGSNYGGGAKANRYIDTANIGGINVSQGTADIGSLSNEALGGTLDFLADNPEMERRVRVSGSIGEFDALRAYVRYDTGDLGGIRAWVSASHQEATDHMEGSAENQRDHFAAKFVADAGAVEITGYASYDDTHEDNYQRVFSAADFAAYPDWDQLIGEWTSIPYVDQAYRRGWSTLRENFFTYLKADAELGAVAVRAAGYFHKNGGRGDWVPPYIVDVTDDGVGNPESEIFGNGTVLGGAALGRIYFIDGTGAALTAADGCVSSITFPYGGAGPEYDPACYVQGAIGAQSYRHTHYRKERLGGTADFDWTATFGQIENSLVGGLWYEDTTRKKWRDWHQIVDTRVGFEFEYPPYWVQYSREYPQSTFKWWLQDSVAFGPVTVTGGIKQFHNDVTREDVFGETSNVDLSTHSDVLLSGGIQVEPLPGLNLFAGYAENYKALGDEILERPDANLDNLQPETSENWEAGVRYNNGVVQASATYFNTTFDNRIIFLAANTDAGPDYLIGTNGTYFNGGGIDSEGFELLAAVQPFQGFTLYGSYTYIDATYKGTGDPLVDEAVGIIPGNRVTGIPKHMFVLSADYSGEFFRAGLSGKYTGDRAVNVANTFMAEHYTTLDAYVGVKGDMISDTLQAVDFNLTVNNVTDEDYLGGISGGGAWIGAPRTVVLTATIDF